jgi:hypothetical protein
MIRPLVLAIPLIFLSICSAQTIVNIEPINLNMINKKAHTRKGEIAKVPHYLTEQNLKILKSGRDFDYYFKFNEFDPAAGFCCIDVDMLDNQREVMAKYPAYARAYKEVIEGIDRLLRIRIKPESKQKLIIKITELFNTQDDLGGGRVVVPYFIIEGKLINENGSDICIFADKRYVNYNPYGSSIDWSKSTSMFTYAFLKEVFEGRITQ